MINTNFIKQDFAQIPVSDFKKEMENDDAVLLDIRTPWELTLYWKLRNNQILIDVNNKSCISKIAELDKSKKYLVYCWHWNRSVMAREYMQKEWFSYVKDLKGWIDEWILEWESVFK
jgi:phage shock protein E